MLPLAGLLRTSVLRVARTWVGLSEFTTRWTARWIVGDEGGDPYTSPYTGCRAPGRLHSLAGEREEGL